MCEMAYIIEYLMSDSEDLINDNLFNKENFEKDCGKTVIEYYYKELGMINNRIEYIKAIISGKLFFTKEGQALSQPEVISKIKELGLCEGFYLSIYGYQIVQLNECNDETIDKLKDKIESHKKIINKLKEI